jgi:hypothetical protein
MIAGVRIHTQRGVSNDAQPSSLGLMQNIKNKKEPEKRKKRTVCAPHLLCESCSILDGVAENLCHQLFHSVPGKSEQTREPRAAIDAC